MKSPDVMQIQLSNDHSLDVVRLRDARKYRVVFAERSGVQRRAFVEISIEEAQLLAGFLAWAPEVDVDAVPEAVPDPVDPDNTTPVDLSR